MSYEQELGGFSQGVVNLCYLMMFLLIGCCRIEIVNSVDFFICVMIKDICFRDVECMCCVGVCEVDVYVGQGDVVDNSGGFVYFGLNRVKYLVRICNQLDFLNEFLEMKERQFQ